MRWGNWAAYHRDSSAEASGDKMECTFNKYHLETSRSHHFQQMPVYHWQIEMFCISPSLQSDFKWQQRVVSTYLDTPRFLGDQIFLPWGGDMYNSIMKCTFYGQKPYVLDWTSWILQLIVCNIPVLGVFWYIWTFFRLTDFEIKISQTL